jgi:group II intron reverse transcriptase/maturase
MTKPFVIPKALVWEAFQRVKANGGSAGVDKESIEEFEKSLGDKLYKLWNRMVSGSYFPPPVKAVPIPKKSGGTRMLGVPTVADRVAQTVVKMVLEPLLEPVFDRDSFGYRPRRSALDAVALVRRRSWKYDWVLEFDIKGLFDNIDHKLLLPRKGQRWRASEALRKGAWSVRCLQISSCTTRWMHGCAARCEAFDFAATQMTVSFTARARCKHGWY